MKNFKKMSVLVLSGVGFAAVFLFSAPLKTGIQNGLTLCGSVIIPSLFPPLCICSFLQLSGALNASGRLCKRLSSILFGLPPCALPVFLLSLISGYPAGAALCAQLQKSGQLTLPQSRLLATVSVGAGPGFLVLAVGDGMLHNMRYGFLLLITHILSAMLTAVLFCHMFKVSDSGATQRPSPRLPLSEAFVQAVAKASASILSICAYTILFSGLIGILSALITNKTGFLAAVAALEVSNGCVFLAQLLPSIPLIAGITGFGGLSVICQILSAAGPARPKTGLFLSARLLNGCISYLLASVLIGLIPNALPVYYGAKPSGFSFSSHTLLFSACLFCLCVVFLFSTRQRKIKKLVDFF